MKIFNERGVSVIFAAGLMVLLSLLGLSVVSQVVTSHTIHSEQLFYDRTFYVTQAGLEYAMRKIYEGTTPVVEEPGIPFAEGSFVVGRIDRLVTVTGRHSNSQVIHSVTSPSHADCTAFDISNVSLSNDDKEIRQISFRKICLEQTVIDKMIVSWTNQGSETLKKVRVESHTLYDLPPLGSGELAELSDYIMTGGQNNNLNEIAFSHNMEDKVFTINFIMGDGSAKSYTFEPDD